MMWKTFAGHRLYQGLQEVQVHQNLVYRWLTFDSTAIQTIINRHAPERSALNYIPALTLAARALPANSCLLGLGGAGVAHALLPHFGVFRLDAVESSQEVIDIAHNYFMAGKLDNLGIIHQDAQQFVQTSLSCYQHLMVDLFNAHSFPEHCNNETFIMQCKRILLPGGILAINLANLHEQWPIFNLVRKQFPHNTIAIPVKGTANMVVLAYNAPSINPLIELLKKNPLLKKLAWDSRWGCFAHIKT